MLIISHRGNIEGPKLEKENTINYIEQALTLNFDVEVDLRYIENGWFLGHDKPQEQVNTQWLNRYKHQLWIHCKNEQAIIELKKTDLNFFWHENDKLTLTSKNYIWAYPSPLKIENSIDVLPELFSDVAANCSNKILGVCTDYALKYRCI